MPGSRQTQQAIVLVIAGVVLALVAAAADVSDWAIVGAFVVVAVVVHFAWPDKPSDE